MESHCEKIVKWKLITKTKGLVMNTGKLIIVVGGTRTEGVD